MTQPNKVLIAAKHRPCPYLVIIDGGTGSHGRDRCRSRHRLQGVWSVRHASDHCRLWQRLLITLPVSHSSDVHFAGSSVEKITGKKKDQAGPNEMDSDTEAKMQMDVIRLGYEGTHLTPIWHPFDTKLTPIWHTFDTNLTQFTPIWHPSDIHLPNQV